MNGLRTYDRLENERQSLIRRIAARKANRQGYRDLEARLNDVVTRQLQISTRVRVPAGRAINHGSAAQ